ncbi:MAG TPA: 2TM domain-containing protein [Acidimicrobiales bacterium]|nr:2TM domain-containing protein [Acidimicrobiales bacterium]
MTTHSHLSSYEVEHSEGSKAPPGTEELARKQAVKQIERRRHFRTHAVATAIGMFILIIIWAVSEYHNAGGWPTHGFSQSSGIHEVWNFWIVYPVGGLGLILAARAWSVYGDKPITEHEIEREVDRQLGRR